MNGLKSGCFGFVAIVVIVAGAFTAYKASRNEGSPTKAYQSLHVAADFNDQQKRDTVAILDRVDRLKTIKDESALRNSLKTISADCESLSLKLPPGDPQTDLLRLIGDRFDLVEYATDTKTGTPVFATALRAKKLLSDRLNDKMDADDKMQWELWCKDRWGGAVKPRIEK